MNLIGIPSLLVPERKITVPEPVVTHRDFVNFEPDGVEISKIRRGQAWYQLVKLFTIDRLQIHGLSTVQSQFGGEGPYKTPLQFNDYPDVQPGGFINREHVDRLSIPSLRQFVDGVATELTYALSPAKQKEILDTNIGCNVGIVILKFWDEAATRFGAPAQVEQPEVEVA